jgi:hypothetical protein
MNTNRRNSDGVIEYVGGNKIARRQFKKDIKDLANELAEKELLGSELMNHLAEVELLESDNEDNS